MAKRALVLSAGGMYGAYQAGAWSVLGRSFQPDVVVGASIGSLNGWAIAGGCPPEELCQRWLGLREAARHRWRFPRSPLDGALDATRLHGWIRDLYESCSPQVPIGVVLTDILRLKPRLFTGPNLGWEHLAASCAIFGILPQIRIHGRYYTDGGLIEPLPLWAAAEMGATEVVAINVLPRLPGTVLQGAVRVFRRIAPRPPLASAEMKVQLIEPKKVLGTAREAIYWTEARAREWIDQGRRDAEEFIASSAAASWPDRRTPVEGEGSPDRL